jgi:hypothetical protein
VQKNPLTTDPDTKLHPFQGREGIFHKKCVQKTFMIVGMADEKVRERKARPAKLACIGLLARVNTLVIPQLVRLGKRFQADGTAVGPLVPAVDLLTVLRIHNILVWIRILRSIPLSNGSEFLH